MVAPVTKSELCEARDTPSGNLFRLFRKIRRSVVHEAFPIERPEEVDQGVDVAMGKVKGTNLRVEVGIPDAAPFVEQDDVPQRR